MRTAAPSLRRYFHRGTPAGSAGMRMKMIGYGRFEYAGRGGQEVEWPVIGLAQQKNYLSVYGAASRDGEPLVRGHAGGLNALSHARGNFSFARFSDLDAEPFAAFAQEAAAIVAADPENPVRAMERR